MKKFDPRTPDRREPECPERPWILRPRSFDGSAFRGWGPKLG